MVVSGFVVLRGDLGNSVKGRLTRMEVVCMVIPWGGFFFL